MKIVIKKRLSVPVYKLFAILLNEYILILISTKAIIAKNILVKNFM